jgi:hypothetical protein
VVLTGIGGIRKTAVAGRATRRLRQEGWLVAVHDGSWSPPALFAAVESALDGRPDLVRVQDALSDAEVEDRRKLALVGQLLQRERLLLVFADFEENLEVGGRSFVDPRLRRAVHRVVRDRRSGPAARDLQVSGAGRRDVHTAWTCPCRR